MEYKENEIIDISKSSYTDIISVYENSILYFKRKFENFDIDKFILEFSENTEFEIKFSYSYDNINWSNPLNRDDWKLNIENQNIGYEYIFLSMWFFKFEEDIHTAKKLQENINLENTNIPCVDNAGNESSGNTTGFTTLEDDSLTITSSAPNYSYGDWLIPDTVSGSLYFANGQPNEVISLLLVLTSNTTPWTEVNFNEEGIISQPLNASNTIRNGTITLDANGVAQGAYWAIGIPTCSCKVTITGRSSGLPIPSANSASFTITRP